jgi:hypothetical protein
MRRRGGPQRKNLKWLRAAIDPESPLGPNAALLVAVLSQLCDYDTLSVRQTQAAMAAHSKLSLSTVKRALVELQEKGYLEKRHRGGRGWASLYVGILPPEPSGDAYPAGADAAARRQWRASHPDG